MDPPEPSGLFGERDGGGGYIHVEVETHIYCMTRVANLDTRKASDHHPQEVLLSHIMLNQGCPGGRNKM